MKILIVEDDNEIVESISLAFQFYWPEAQLLSTHLGKEGIKLVRKENPDAVILDPGLPDINSLDVLKKIRRFSSILIIILMVKTYENDVVNALKKKADDYMAKPFKQLELLKRLKALVDAAVPQQPLIYSYISSARQHVLDSPDSTLLKSRHLT